jgi:hypothetical protein
MGYMDKFGELAGKAMAFADDVNELKNEYVGMSTDELIREKKSLMNKSCSDKNNRLLAITSVLNNRGVDPSKV